MREPGLGGEAQRVKRKGEEQDSFVKACRAADSGKALCDGHAAVSASSGACHGRLVRRSPYR